MWNLEPFCWFLHQAYTSTVSFEFSLSFCDLTRDTMDSDCAVWTLRFRRDGTRLIVAWSGFNRSIHYVCRIWLEVRWRFRMTIDVSSVWCWNSETDQENTIDWLHPKQSAWLVWNVWLLFKFSVSCTFFLGSWFCFCWVVQPAKHQKLSMWSIKWSSFWK